MNSPNYPLVVQQPDPSPDLAADAQDSPISGARPAARRRGAIRNHWIAALFPIIALVVGLYVYRQDVATSLTDTPHPMLIYSVLVAMIVGTVITYRVLRLAVREHRRMEAYLRRADEPTSVAAPDARRSAYASVYALLGAMPSKTARVELGRRLAEAQHSIDGKLTLPGYVAGSLVGIGLVGTFVGLLGALRELGGLFSGMMSGAAGSGGSAADMFSAMLLKLHAPMQSMGTAFVASLYGVLGSLVLGVVLVIVSRAVAALLGEVREHAFSCFDARLDAIPAEPSPPALEPAIDAEEFHRRQSALLTLLESSTADTIALRHTSTSIAEKVDAALNLFQARAEQDAQMHRFMSTGSHWMRAWADISEHLHALRGELSRDDRQLSRSWEYFAATIEGLRGEIRSLATMSEQWHTDATQRADATQANARVVLQVATERIDAIVAGVTAANGQDMRVTVEALHECRASFDRISGRLDTLLACWLEQEQAHADSRFTQ